MSGLPPPSSSLPPPPRFDYGREDGYQGRPYDGPKDRAYDRDRDNWERDSRRDHQHRGPGGPRSRTPEGRGVRRLYDRENRSIEERIQQERPCRTLFVRNVQYDADPESLRLQFESFGQIKNFYEMVSKRGMIFISYFDSRAAQRARDAMHGTLVNRRPIDVHYSLPRSEEVTGACTAEKNQGTILVLLHPPRTLDINEIGRIAAQYGDIKDVVPGRVPSEIIVEYFDSRGAALFQQQMDRQPLLGGELELRFIWDKLDNNVPPPPAAVAKASRPSTDYDDRARGPPPRRDDAYNDSRGGRFGPRGGARERSPDYRDRRGSYETGYGGRPSGPSPGRYHDAPPAPASVSEDRLEQALRVQQLLNKIGNVNVPPVAATPPTAPPAPSYYRSPPVMPPSTTPYPPHGASYASYPPYPTPTPNAYGSKPPYVAPPFPPYPPPAAGGSVPPEGMGPLPGRQHPAGYGAPPPLPPFPPAGPTAQAIQPAATAPQGQQPVKDVGSLLAMLQGKQ
ncbi:hypothetical protein CNBJ1460 [Cryptococcus deneoformans B-3501A]|uniref:RRM domain-containing protein n=1 Tax=Cryptococcus deneoformans (strain JEC21 / ATCC MYA-565) TaxID=214684 RepID=Q5KAE2_CRYD1|nr:conserved hypothetical protein [Cryptococcus neoformans var. neoformans JEC21]XP_773151.1 hypothetical protein CNBJ1460 [Cryptococcus neoformans var. neoformans B-3501A]AAW45857.1 conserved hypothetical protein [Cryptococcus neoformans var. neoformans JEC21]EAL18504.1 hypothetical protein CNBJ1460 [Cryptococcus neoformans var. neoformans B-3501A]